MGPKNPAVFFFGGGLILLGNWMDIALTVHGRWYWYCIVMTGIRSVANVLTKPNDLHELISLYDITPLSCQRENAWPTYVFSTDDRFGTQSSALAKTIITTRVRIFKLLLTFYIGPIWSYISCINSFHITYKQYTKFSIAFLAFKMLFRVFFLIKYYTIKYFVL